MFVSDPLDPARGTIRVELRNTGLVDLETTQFGIIAGVPGAAAFPGGADVQQGRLPPEQATAATLAVVVNACLLPPHPSQAGFRLFDYTVRASAPGPGQGDVSHEVTYHAAVPEPVAPCLAVAP